MWSHVGLCGVKTSVTAVCVCLGDPLFCTSWNPFICTQFFGRADEVWLVVVQQQSVVGDLIPARGKRNENGYEMSIRIPIFVIFAVGGCVCGLGGSFRQM